MAAGPELTQRRLLREGGGGPSGATPGTRQPPRHHTTGGPARFASLTNRYDRASSGHAADPIVTDARGLAVALADAFLTTAEWRLSALVARGGLVLGVRRRWLGRSSTPS